jgi:hypothetical protein
MYKSSQPLRAQMDCPSGDEVLVWMETNGDEAALTSIPAICADNLGLYLFLKYCAHNGDIASVLFLEATIKMKVRRRHRGRRRGRG